MLFCAVVGAAWLWKGSLCGELYSRSLRTGLAGGDTPDTALQQQLSFTARKDLSRFPPLAQFLSQPVTLQYLSPAIERLSITISNLPSEPDPLNNSLFPSCSSFAPFSPPKPLPHSLEGLRAPTSLLPPLRLTITMSDRVR